MAARRYERTQNFANDFSTDHAILDHAAAMCKKGRLSGSSTMSGLAPIR
jgi:hypothetical protein